MSEQSRIYNYATLLNIANRLRDDFISGNRNFVLLFAHNGTGKTRLSTEFKNAGKQIDCDDSIINRDTLYFNAFTEDLFYWDNDIENDLEPSLLVNSNSRFIDGFSDLDLDDSINEYFQRYCAAQFEIVRYSAEEVDEMARPSSPLHYLYRRFGAEVEARPKCIKFRSKNGEDWIKISRGEERIFVWSVFLAIFKQVLEGEAAYRWVKYIYIDDPVSSLDENNVISVACDLAELLREAKNRIGSASMNDQESFGRVQEGITPLNVVISSHHALFFNVISNELKCKELKKYFLHRMTCDSRYTLRATGETPFFHHVALLSELVNLANSTSQIVYGYHFNMLRSILEKTAVFFGKKNFSDCIDGEEDKALFSRALNLQSHGKHSLFAPVEMSREEQDLFRRILESFTRKFQFNLPEVIGREPSSVTAS